MSKDKTPAAPWQWIAVGAVIAIIGLLMATSDNAQGAGALFLVIGVLMALYGVIVTAMRRASSGEDRR